MINARMMYCRPGNLFKEFVIEDNTQTVTSTGRVAQNHSGSGIRTLKGCLAEATDNERSMHSRNEHTVTHTIVQAGAPKAKESDRLILGDRIFYVVDVDGAGAIGISTLYYVEERGDVK